MKVFVAGGTGRVATETIRHLEESNHQVRVGARRPEAVKASDKTKVVVMDLHATVDELAKVVSGCDAVIFAAGSRGKDLLQTDAFGAVKLMQAAKKAGISRFVMLSALYSLEPEQWDKVGSLKDYYVAKFFADNYLVNQSGLDYTIIQPGALLETAGNGKISLGEQGLTSISIDDVAATLVASLDVKSTSRKVIAIHPGEETIKTALTDLAE